MLEHPSAFGGHLHHFSRGCLVADRHEVEPHLRVAAGDGVKVKVLEVAVAQRNNVRDPLQANRFHDGRAHVSLAVSIQMLNPAFGTDFVRCTQPALGLEPLSFVVPSTKRNRFCRVGRKHFVNGIAQCPLEDDEFAVFAVAVFLHGPAHIAQEGHTLAMAAVQERNPRALLREDALHWLRREIEVANWNIDTFCCNFHLSIVRLCMQVADSPGWKHHVQSAAIIRCRRDLDGCATAGAHEFASGLAIGKGLVTVPEHGLDRCCWQVNSLLCSQGQLQLMRNAHRNGRSGLGHGLQAAL